jgi:hypothetical protein
MKLKNSLPISIFGLIVVLIVFYAFKDHKGAKSNQKSNYELSFEDDSYEPYQQQSQFDSPQNNKKIKEKAARKLKNFRLSMNKQRSSERFTDAPVKETPQEEASEQNTAQNNQTDEEKKDEEEDEEKKEGEGEDTEEIASDNEVTRPEKRTEDFESIEASSYVEPIFIGSNTNIINNTNDENEEDTAENSRAAAQGGQSNSNNNNDDADNESFGDVNLTELSDLITENKFEEIQLLVNSSGLSTFRREALQILVSNSFDQENREEIGSIITQAYFNTSHLGLFTQSMVQDNYSVQQKTYMGTLILQNLNDSTNRLSQAEFVDLYFNGVRALLPTPANVNEPELAELYLTIDYSIEENFALYGSNSQVAVSQ